MGCMAGFWLFFFLFLATMILLPSPVDLLLSLNALLRRATRASYASRVSWTARARESEETSASRATRRRDPPRRAMTEWPTATATTTSVSPSDLVFALFTPCSRLTTPSLYFLLSLSRITKKNAPGPRREAATTTTASATTAAPLRPASSPSPARPRASTTAAALAAVLPPPLLPPPPPPRARPSQSGSTSPPTAPSRGPTPPPGCCGGSRGTTSRWTCSCARSGGRRGRRSSR